MPEFLDLHGKTNKVVRAAAEAALQRHGLHLGQDHLLAALWEQDGRTPGEIAAAANVTTPAVTKVTGRMIEAGLVTRRRDERDNRLVAAVADRRRTRTARTGRDGTAAARRRGSPRASPRRERKHLMSALAKIQRAAADLLGGEQAEPG